MREGRNIRLDCEVNVIQYSELPEAPALERLTRWANTAVCG